MYPHSCPAVCYRSKYQTEGLLNHDRKKAYWLLPTSVKGASYKECRDINFTSAKSMKKKLDSNISASATRNDGHNTAEAGNKQKVPEPSPSELSELLHSTGSKPAIL